jgi:hypothetical protein
MRALSAVVMIFAVTVAVGCGSSRPSSVSAHAGALTGTTSSRTTRAHFVAAADEICQTLHSRQRPLEARVHTLTEDTPGTRKLLEVLLRQSVTFARAADARLQALPRPPGDATAIGKLVTGYVHEAAEVTSYTEALSKQEPEKQSFASGSLERTTASDRALAEGLGMTVCAASE